MRLQKNKILAIPEFKKTKLIYRDLQKISVTNRLCFPLDLRAFCNAENKGYEPISTYLSTDLWKAARYLKCHFKLFVYNVLQGQL